MAEKRRRTDKPFGIIRVVTSSIACLTLVTLIWAAATPYIDQRIDKKIRPIDTALEYLKQLGEIDKTDAQIKSARLRASKPQ